MRDTAAQQWARTHFAGSAMPDRRLCDRLATIAAAMARNPDASIPQQAGSWSCTLATYRLLHNERIEPQAIQHDTIRQTRQMCAASSSVVLCLHDLTPLEPVHSMSRTRLQQHTVLAVAGDDGGAIHGLLHQRWFHDPKPARGESRTQRRARWSRSQCWPEAVEAVGAPEGDARWIAVADREADDFQMFHACRDAGQGFVIRAQHDRCVASGDEGEMRLREMMERQPVAGGIYVQVSRQGTVGVEAPPKRRRTVQKGRLARLEVRDAAVTLKPPRNDPRYKDGFAVHVVFLREIDAPEDVSKPIDWLLLTTEPVTSMEEALAIIGWYRRRWLIEEFHKALKTGCRLEQTQLEDAKAFIRLAAITAVVAVRLLHLREAADDERTAKDRAIDHVDQLWVEVVCRVGQHNDPETLTLQTFYHTIAKKGGWLGRRGDGRPGWQTLWLGWQTIANYVAGIELMRNVSP